MYVSYLTPLHNDLVTNNFNAASAELEFQFLGNLKYTETSTKKMYSIKSAPCGGLIKNLYWVIDTRVVINP